MQVKPLNVSYLICLPQLASIVSSFEGRHSNTLLWCLVPKMAGFPKFLM